MNTCKTCKWWVKDGIVWGTCKLTISNSGMPAEEYSTLAIAKDGDYYHAWLETRENFGCVQWESKDDS